MNAPFQRNARSVPVTLVTGPAGKPLPVPPDTALLVVPKAPGHDHNGAECLVCAAHGDIRVMLFALQERQRLGAVPAYASVLVDARGIDDTETLAKRITPGALPAFGLRDHAVARNFHLAEVVIANAQGRCTPTLDPSPQGGGRHPCSAI